MTKAGQKAYADALAPHHPWALRKVVSVGMNAMPARTAFLTSVIK